VQLTEHLTPIVHMCLSALVILVHHLEDNEEDAAKCGALEIAAALGLDAQLAQSEAMVP
jgi:hypothetical protein